LLKRITGHMFTLLLSKYIMSCLMFGCLSLSCGDKK
jgi:hypothetical protein